MKRIVLLALVALGLLSCTTKEFNVVDFGAVGDGVTLNTEAIQNAIDAAAGKQGTVVFPAGTFLSGAIYLKSNLHIRLDAGAVLKASPDSADYSPVDVCPQNHPIVNDHSYGGHFILCIEQNNIVITGPGTIDGNSPAFTYTQEGKAYASKLDIPWRPGQMLYFVDSKNICISELELADSPYWNCYFYNCSNIVVSDAHIHSRRMPVSWNGDGIDIDCCQNVCIKDCDINTNDDCIAIRADERWSKNAMECRNIVVSDCDLSSLTSAVRFGVGNGVISNVVVSDVDIHNTRSAFSFTSGWSKKTRGVEIKNVSISDVEVRNTVILFQIYPKKATGEVSTHDIVFNDIDAEVELPSQIYGHPENHYSNFVFLDVECNRPIDMKWVDNVKTEKSKIRFVNLSAQDSLALEQNYQKRKAEVKVLGI